jgi:hypothetical protein
MRRKTSASIYKKQELCAYMEENFKKKFSFKHPGMATDFPRLLQLVELSQLHRSLGWETYQHTTYKHQPTIDHYSLIIRKLTV